MQLYTWGSGYHGQLALGTRQVQATPSIVSKLLTTQQLLTKVWCGSHHCAGVTTDGELYTWGSNRTGCLGRTLPGTIVTVQIDNIRSHSSCRGVWCCGGVQKNTRPKTMPQRFMIELQTAKVWGQNLSSRSKSRDLNLVFGTIAH